MTPIWLSRFNGGLLLAYMIIQLQTTTTNEISIELNEVNFQLEMKSRLLVYFKRSRMGMKSTEK